MGTQNDVKLSHHRGQQKQIQTIPEYFGNGYNLPILPSLPRNKASNEASQGAGIFSLFISHLSNFGLNPPQIIPPEYYSVDQSPPSRGGGAEYYLGRTSFGKNFGCKIWTAKCIHVENTIKTMVMEFLSQKCNSIFSLPFSIPKRKNPANYIPPQKYSPK